MYKKTLKILLTLFSATFVFTETNTAQIKHSVPTAQIGDFELTTQAFGQFGTVPHKKIEPGAVNYYAQFSIWAGAVTEQGEIRVTSGETVEAEWTPVPLTWKENAETTLPAVKQVNTGQFTDTRTFENHTPLGLLVTLTVYSFSKKGYALFDYAVELSEGFSPLKGLYLGLQADVDVPDGEGKLTSDNDRLRLLSSEKGMTIYDGKANEEAAPGLGICLFGAEDPVLTWWTRETDPKTDEERYALLCGHNRFPANPDEPADYRFMVSEGPYTLEYGQVIHLTVGVLQARGEQAFESQTQAAEKFFAQHLASNMLAMGTAQEITKETTTLSVPSSFRLHPGSPNPFNIQTQISFDLPESREVEVTIINLLGQPVKQLFSGKKEAGTHTLRWDGTNGEGQVVVSGVYLVILKAGQTRLQQKLVLMK